MSYRQFADWQCRARGLHTSTCMHLCQGRLPSSFPSSGHCQCLSLLVPLHHPIASLDQDDQTEACQAKQSHRQATLSEVSHSTPRDHHNLYKSGNETIARTQLANARVCSTRGLDGTRRDSQSKRPGFEFRAVHFFCFLLDKLYVLGLYVYK